MFIWHQFQIITGICLLQGPYKKLAKEDPMSNSKFCQSILLTLALTKKRDFFKILTQHNQISWKKPNNHVSSNWYYQFNENDNYNLHFIWTYHQLHSNSALCLGHDVDLLKQTKKRSNCNFYTTMVKLEVYQISLYFKD